MDGVACLECGKMVSFMEINDHEMMCKMEAVDGVVVPPSTGDPWDEGSVAGKSAMKGSTSDAATGPAAPAEAPDQSKTVSFSNDVDEAVVGALVPITEAEPSFKHHDVWNPPESYKLRNEYRNKPAKRECFTGLLNQGATCYLNSLVQTLFMCKDFRQEILEWEIPENMQTDVNVPHQLQLLFANMRFGYKAEVVTKGLTRAFGWTSSDHFQQHDVQELNRVLFEALQKYIDRLKSKDYIRKLFEGMMGDYVRCNECQNLRERDAAFQDVTIPIKEKADLQEALLSFVSAEVMEGDNKVFCEKCDDRQNSRKGLHFKALPPVLTLQLQRFDFDYELLRREKLYTNVRIPQVVNLGHLHPQADRFAVSDSRQLALLALACNRRGGAMRLDANLLLHLHSYIEHYTYELLSVLAHRGTTGAGHYIAYIKDLHGDMPHKEVDASDPAAEACPSKGWYTYNDESVTAADPLQLMECIDPTRWEQHYDDYSPPATRPAAAVTCVVLTRSDPESAAAAPLALDAVVPIDSLLFLNGQCVVAEEVAIGQGGDRVSTLCEGGGWDLLCVSGDTVLEGGLKLAPGDVIHTVQRGLFLHYPCDYADSDAAFADEQRRDGCASASIRLSVFPKYGTDLLKKFRLQQRAAEIKAKNGELSAMPFLGTIPPPPPPPQPPAPPAGGPLPPPPAPSAPPLCPAQQQGAAAFAYVATVVFSPVTWNVRVPAEDDEEQEGLVVAASNEPGVQTADHVTHVDGVPVHTEEELVSLCLAGSKHTVWLKRPLKKPAAAPPAAVPVPRPQPEGEISVEARTSSPVAAPVQVETCADAGAVVGKVDKWVPPVPPPQPEGEIMQEEKGADAGAAVAEVEEWARLLPQPPPSSPTAGVEPAELKKAADGEEAAKTNFAEMWTNYDLNDASNKRRLDDDKAQSFDELEMPDLFDAVDNVDMSLEGIIGPQPERAYRPPAAATLSSAVVHTPNCDTERRQYRSDRAPLSNSRMYPYMVVYRKREFSTARGGQTEKTAEQVLSEEFHRLPAYMQDVVKKDREGFDDLLERYEEVADLVEVKIFRHLKDVTQRLTLEKSRAAAAAGSSAELKGDASELVWVTLHKSDTIWDVTLKAARALDLDPAGHTPDTLRLRYYVPKKGVPGLTLPSDKQGLMTVSEAGLQPCCSFVVERIDPGESESNFGNILFEPVTADDLRVRLSVYRPGGPQPHPDLPPRNLCTDDETLTTVMVSGASDMPTLFYKIAAATGIDSTELVLTKNGKRIATDFAQGGETHLHTLGISNDDVIRCERLSDAVDPSCPALRRFFPADAVLSPCNTLNEELLHSACWIGVIGRKPKVDSDGDAESDGGSSSEADIFTEERAARDAEEETFLGFLCVDKMTSSADLHTLVATTLDVPECLFTLRDNGPQFRTIRGRRPLSAFLPSAHSHAQRLVSAPIGVREAPKHSDYCSLIRMTDEKSLPVGALQLTVMIKIHMLVCEHPPTNLCDYHTLPPTQAKPTHLLVTSVKPDDRVENFKSVLLKNEQVWRHPALLSPQPTTNTR